MPDSPQETRDLQFVVQLKNSLGLSPFLHEIHFGKGIRIWTMGLV